MRPAGRLVVMGVSGSGKTTVGQALAAALDVPFVDADDLHPPANIATMASGTPLEDDDRWPWLDAVAAWLDEHPGGVVACSALRRSYRDRLRRTAPSAWFVHLVGDPDLVAERQAARTGHFMPAGLQASQQQTLEPLEPDEPGLRLDVSAPVDDLVRRVLAALPPA